MPTIEVRQYLTIPETSDWSEETTNYTKETNDWSEETINYTEETKHWSEKTTDDVTDE